MEFRTLLGLLPFFAGKWLLEFPIFVAKRIEQFFVFFYFCKPGNLFIEIVIRIIIVNGRHFSYNKVSSPPASRRIYDTYAA